MSDPDRRHADRRVRAFRITGVTVAADGTLYYAEEVADPRFLILVRAVRDGRVATVLGRVPARTESESQVVAAVVRAGDPAPGSRATDLVAGGIGARLAASPGGKLYVSTNEHDVLALAPDGTAAAVLAGRAPRVVRQPTTPFESIGKAVDAQPQLFLSDSRVSLSAYPVGGDLYLVTQLSELNDPRRRPLRPFVWSGSFSAAQKDLVGQQRTSVAVWRVDGQGQLATAAFGADAVAVPGGTGCTWHRN